jgi:iron complex outermembrane receptor protein
MKNEMICLMLALAATSSVLAGEYVPPADDFVPPVTGGRTWAQHLAEDAKSHHPEINSIVVTGKRGNEKNDVVFASTLGVAAVFGKAPNASLEDGAAASADGKSFVVREPYLNSTDHRIGTIEVSFKNAPGKAADFAATAKAVQAEMRPVTLSAKNAVDPYPYYSGFSMNTYAQAITEKEIKAHPQIIVMMIHATPPGKDINVVIGSNIGRIGKWADADDMRIVQKGTTNLEMAAEGDRFETALPLNDAKGKQIGALGLVYSFKKGDDKEKLHALGIAIRDEVAKMIPDNAALFAPR